MSADNLWLVGSTLAGALVGGLASGFATWLAALDTSRREAAEQLRTYAFQLVIKAKLLADDAYSIHSQIEETISAAEAAGVKGPTWSKLSGILPGDVPPTFLETREVSLLIRRKREGIANQFILETLRARSLTVALTSYVERRDKLTSAFPASMNGRVGTTLFTEESISALSPRMVEVGLLADDIRARAAEHYKNTMRIVRDLGPALTTILKDEKFPVPVVPDEHLAAIADRPVL